MNFSADIHALGRGVHALRAAYDECEYDCRGYDNIGDYVE